MLFKPKEKFLVYFYVPYVGGTFFNSIFFNIFWKLNVQTLKRFCELMLKLFLFFFVHLQIAARPGAHKLRCLFRVTYVPVSAALLAQKDLNALDYLYMQSCNDVTQERFSPELQPEVALRLAALHIHQHSLANNISPAKLTIKTVE